jgi:hypothetical protein
MEQVEVPGEQHVHLGQGVGLRLWLLACHPAIVGNTSEKLREDGVTVSARR